MTITQCVKGYFSLNICPSQTVASEKELLCSMVKLQVLHADVIKWKHFPRYWPFVRGIHRSPVNSLHKGQWRGSLMFALICAWINAWVNNLETGDLRRHQAHYDVILMLRCSMKSPGIFTVQVFFAWLMKVVHFNNFKRLRKLSISYPTLKKIMMKFDDMGSKSKSTFCNDTDLMYIFVDICVFIYEKINSRESNKILVTQISCYQISQHITMTS